MVAKAWRCLFCAIVALSVAPVYGAGAGDRVPEPECEEQKRIAMEERVRGTTIDLIDALPEKWDNRAVTVNFMHMEFDDTIVDDQTLTYGCEPVKRHSFPAYAGFAWMILMPNKTGFSLIGPSRTETTIRSYLEEEIGDGQNGVSALRVLVSGPFWKLSRHGEVPIGALVKDNKVEHDFRPNFSAKYVLCSTKDGSVDLREGKVGMFKKQSPSEEESRPSECTTAIQVGPALFEPKDEYVKLGIGADAKNRSRRNVLIKVDSDAPGSRSGGSLILLSTLFDITSYDAMIASQALVDELALRDKMAWAAGKIVWAVGLVDDESLSGPILTMEGRPMLELTEASRPTGAIMQFIFNGGDRPTIRLTP